MMKTCEFCYKQVNSDYSKRRFCSVICNNSSKRGKPIPSLTNYYKNRRIRGHRLCIYCNKEFPIRNNKSKKFCGNKCYINSRWQYTGKCYVCSKEISQSRYCKDCRKSREVFKKIHYKKSHEYQKKKEWREKLDIMKELGGKCVKCGVADIRMLDINHIERAKKSLPMKNQTTYARLKEWRINFHNLELLCANCHRVHTWEQMQYKDLLIT